jgi:hypothetical protein
VPKLFATLISSCFQVLPETAISHQARISPMINSDRPLNSRARRIAIGHTAAVAWKNRSHPAMERVMEAFR